jgi:16S rRNA (uracil1498-N3)-methyltransferase
VHTWGSEKDYARAERIFIAAAEQSKQFVLPDMKPVCNLATAIANLGNEYRLFFDAAGKPLPELASHVLVHKPASYACLFGPEGDLTPLEKEQILNKGFTFYRLTPSILRAQQAISVALGLLRAIT